METLSLVRQAAINDFGSWSTHGFPDWSSLRAQGLMYPALSDLFTVFLTSAAFLAVTPIFQFFVFPRIGAALGLKGKSQLGKFSDAALQLAYFTPMFFYESYLCLSSDWLAKLEFFADTPYPLTTENRWVYIIQLSWYIYGLLILAIVPSTRRKDIVVIVIHHVVTILVVGGSYITADTRIGLAVFAVHDGPDVVMNLAKLFNYAGWQKVCDALFVAFALVWVVTRDILLPIMLKNSWGVVVERAARGYIVVGHFAQTCLLSILQVLHVYWTALIARMAYRFIAVKAVEKDIRSDSEDES